MFSQPTNVNDTPAISGLNADQLILCAQPEVRLRVASLRIDQLAISASYEASFEIYADRYLTADHLTGARAYATYRVGDEDVADDKTARVHGVIAEWSFVGRGDLDDAYHYRITLASPLHTLQIRQMARVTRLFVVSFDFAVASNKDSPEISSTCPTTTSKVVHRASSNSP